MLFGQSAGVTLLLLSSRVEFLFVGEPLLSVLQS